MLVATFGVVCGHDSTAGPGVVGIRRVCLPMLHVGSYYVMSDSRGGGPLRRISRSCVLPSM